MTNLLSRTQVCQMLGVSPKTLYLWERDGKIPAPRRTRRGWRAYSPRDLQAIRARLGEEAPPPPPRTGDLSASTRALEGLSARNQLRGTVVGIHGDSLLCEVLMRLGDGQEVSAVITRVSAERLRLRRGEPVTAVIKATEVMLFR